MKLNKTPCDLNSCSYCKGCLPEWLPAISASRKTYDFRKGEKLFEEGERVTGIYFLVRGKVKVHKRWDDDKELIVRIAGADEIVGHRGLGKKLIYPVSATTLESVTACFVDLDFFLASLKVNHAYALQLLLFFAEELQESEKNMRNLAHMPVKGRLAHALLKLESKFGTTEEGFINIQLSRQDLALYAGTSYETTFRTLNELIAEKLIFVSEKLIGISNREVLSALWGNS